MDNSTLHIVVMGVSGCGKSTVGTLLAREVGGVFLDGDELHPQANVTKMAAGIPLDDADREPWLREVGRRLKDSEAPLVIACSALKRSYRDLVRASAPQALFVHLHGTRELLTTRMAARPGHFMPLSLLDSQLSTLEPLGSDESGIQLDIAQTPESIVERAAAWARKPLLHA
ncbi:gluconokinase [Sinomonas humi]|uniref:Gluconokinase n=1 Tax=Sinomonas humi TaxID=1338436 RepID=A0A0B2AQU0_9MICC|nr:gluconokinase [Sinomonas humi]KHL04238.1 gluconate kinase [Sinomonas humi]